MLESLMIKHCIELYLDKSFLKVFGSVDGLELVKGGSSVLTM